jgi:GNAT superfamily N-acetyltransferase
MQIRPMTASDLDNLREIDGTVSSTEYLHIERTGEALAVAWKIEPRKLREKYLERRALDDDQYFAIKQIATGADEGVAFVADYSGVLVAAAGAQQDSLTGALRLIDLRVDSDYRRQGIGSGLIFQIIQFARDKELRAVTAQLPANNFPGHEFLSKFGFELTGLDTHRMSNYDLVKETATLFWYLTLP